jgi:Leucine-rich repeat (LRR) protein
MAWLCVLTVDHSKVLDVTAMAELHALIRLDLSGTEVVDVHPLTHLENLRLLNLEGTRVTDVSSLRFQRRLAVRLPDGSAWGKPTAAVKRARRALKE